MAAIHRYECGMVSDLQIKHTSHIWYAVNKLFSWKLNHSHTRWLSLQSSVLYSVAGDTLPSYRPMHCFHIRWRVQEPLSTTSAVAGLCSGLVCSRWALNPQSHLYSRTCLPSPDVDMCAADLHRCGPHANCRSSGKGTILYLKFVLSTTLHMSVVV